MKHNVKFASVLALGTLSLRPTAQAQTREKIRAAVPMPVALFPLEDVRLLDGPFKRAQDTDKAYLLQLNPDSLLAWMRQMAGLKPKASHYEGWDSGGSGMIGHYLSAAAQMAQATGDPELRRRVAYIVAEMAAIQTVNGDGGLYDSPWSKAWFSKIAAGHVEPANTTPWYVMHKTLAGVRDAWLLCGDEQAREVLVKMGNWAIQTTAKLRDTQWQEMLGPPQQMGEFGGPHEPLADIYAVTGDAKYLKLAERFRHNIIFDPVARGDVTVLNGQHANTEIPKFIGYERIYELSGEPLWHTAALNFWHDVTAERTWANGGNSQWEHFYAPAEFPAKMQEICGPETCNTYNMLKLTQELYTTNPASDYIDYYENALYNHILPSEAPGGGFVYYTPMRPGHYRVYSRPYDAFWCCVGTGMENHGKYGAMIYAHSTAPAATKRLYVNLFIPSVLTWKEKGLMLRQDTTLPEQPKTLLTLTLQQPKKLTLSIRYPVWATGHSPQISVNGKFIKIAAQPNSYINITRRWKSGDRVAVTLPLRVTTQKLPGGADYAAFFYGPVLLAGPLGTEGLTKDDFYGGGGFETSGQLASKTLPLDKVPSLLGTPAEAAAHVARIPGPALAFRTQDMGQPHDVTLIPFYDLHFQRYALYWPFKTPTQVAEAQIKPAVWDARTIDRVEIGEAASEAAHQLASDHSRTGAGLAPFTHWRDATAWFSYQMKVPADQPVALRCAYFGSDTGRTFDISVDGKVIATQHLIGEKPGEVLYVNYPIPLEFTKGKAHITVRFEAKQGTLAGGVLDCRIVYF